MSNRIAAILIAFAIMFAVEGLGLGANVSLPVGGFSYLVVRYVGGARGGILGWIRDRHDNLSWKAGHASGKKNVPFRCPWWADERVYSLAYMQGKGVETTDSSASGADLPATTIKQNEDRGDNGHIARRYSLPMNFSNERFLIVVGAVILVLVGVLLYNRFELCAARGWEGASCHFDFRHRLRPI